MKILGGANMKQFISFCIGIFYCVSAFQSTDAFAWGGYEVGGLSISNQKTIAVASQDLYLSSGLVKSIYIFKNTGSSDVLTDVKFVLPSVDLFPDLDESAPKNFQFFHNDVEIFPSFTTINTNEDGAACVDGHRYCSEQTTYFWRQRFQPNNEVKITLQYEPAAGGDFGGLYDTEEVNQEDKAYCIKDDYLPALKKRYNDGYTFWYDQYLYFGPADNLGPIGSFRLVVDKGKVENLISFCGDNVKKISPTQFEMLKTNFTPPKSIGIRWSSGFTKQ